MAVDVSKHLERAKRYLEKNKLQDAIEEYQQVLAAAPGHLEAIQALGDIYARNNEGARASLYYGMLFDRFVENREEAKALALYTRFLKRLPQPPERIARHALLLQKQKRLEEAIEQYTAAADLFRAQRKENDGLDCLERLAQLDPENMARHIALGELAEQVGYTALAARALLRAGQLALAAGEIEQALGWLARAHQQTPGERSVSLLYAQAMLRQGDPASVSAAIELLGPFATSVTDAEFLETYGEALLRAGQFDRARGVIEQVYREKTDSFEKLFELAHHYLQARREEDALQVLRHVKQRMFDSRRESEFVAQLDRIAGANAASIRLTEFWAAVYGELNREAMYFEALVRLFDLYLEAGNLSGACETLERLVDIDPYDFRNQRRLELLQGRASADFLRAVSSRLAKAASQGQRTPLVDRSLSDAPASSETPEGRAHQALEDLIVQAEIFLQYSLQPKAVERLQKIAEMFPGEAEHNERLLSLYEAAHWWPADSKRRPAAEKAAGAAPTGRTGVYTAETLRDLARISEINHAVFRQATPRQVLSVAVNEVGTYLRATRCLAVVGAPGQPPQMAAEFCAPGVEASPGAVVVRFQAQLERAAPDTLGGLALDATAAPVLREMGLETALGVQLIDKDTRAVAGMLGVGYAAPHKWKPNETFFLLAVGDQMLLSVNHTRLRTLVRTLAVADEKTGLLARSSYLDCLLGETQRARMRGIPLSLAILQMDRGPELVQQQGEALVERHMEQLARALQPAIRQNDLAVKYTSWALAFILPDTSLANARALAERLRKMAGGVGPPWNRGQLTLSAGVVEALARADYDSEDIVTDLINRAESSLDEARRKGGDTLVSLEIPRR